VHLDGRRTNDGDAGEKKYDRGGCDRDAVVEVHCERRSAGGAV
jgi:hypothetical protein